jgi:hypothetical protein
VGLIPEPVYNVRSPVTVPQRAVFRIDGSGKNSAGALLYASKAAHAGIQVFGLVHGTHVKEIFLEDIVHTVFLHTAPTATGTILLEFHGGIFTGRMEPWWGGLC